MKGMIVAVLAVLPLWPAVAQMRVHVINVGQGASTLFEFPCGCALVDTGGEKSSEFSSTPVLIDYLKQFFASRPDLNNTIGVLYLTHPHIDHTRGAVEVWEGFRVVNLVTNGSERRSSGSAQQNTVQARARGTEETEAMTDDVGFEGVHLAEIATDAGLRNAVIDPINCPGIDPRFTVLWGTLDEKPVGWTKAAFEDQNNHSVVVRVDYGQSSMLVPGDVEEEAIGKLVDKYRGSGALDVDVNHVAHHGSKNGTTAELMRASTPKLAVMGTGDPSREENWTAWAYGHPNAGVVQLLAGAVSMSRAPVRVAVGSGARNFSEATVSKAVYATGWDGGLVLETPGDGNWVVRPSTPNPGGAPVPAGLLNINTASEDELVALPAIGRVRAQAVIRYRNENGAIGGFEDLDRVPGFGPATIEALQGRIVFR